MSRAGEHLAGAVRDLIEEIAARAHDDEALDRAAADLRDAVGRLRAAGRPRTFAIPAHEGAGPESYLRLSPIAGPLNPLAPPLRLETVDGAVHGSVQFGPAYQGPPGCVHGAFVAAAFDEVLGAANVASGVPGMTVRLDVRYLRPTPLGTPVRVVGRHTRREGRRIFASGRMLAGDEVTAEAEGVFAEITPERARRLFARALGLGPDAPGEPGIG